MAIDEYELTAEEQEMISELNFEVKGAGTLKVGKYNCSKTGGIKGFSFSVSWGRYGPFGGVLSDDEAKKLAEHILEALKR